MEMRRFSDSSKRTLFPASEAQAAAIMNYYYQDRK